MILLVTGGRTFCEATPGREREDYMAERIALGFALDWIKPDGVVCDDENGAGRWARIWCERRGVPTMIGAYEAAVVFPEGEAPAGVDIFSVTVK